MKRYMAAATLLVGFVFIGNAASAQTPSLSCSVTATPLVIPAGTSTEVTVAWNAPGAKGKVLEMLGAGRVSGFGGTNASGWVKIYMSKGTLIKLVALSNPTFQTSGVYALCSTFVAQQL